jgi:hypothetical protein
VNVLPVVDGLVALVTVVSDAAAEVDGQLADESETSGVSNGLINAPELSTRVLHQVDTSNGVNGCVAAALDKTLVCGLESVLTDSSITNDSQTTQDKEGGDPGSLGGGGG